MNDLILQRYIFGKTATIGGFYIDGEPFCWSLEDTVRKTKLYGKTAIPSGRYQIVPHEWKGIIVPKLLKVPFFEGILIHPGNDDMDTEGCILTGFKATFKYVEVSRVAFKDLMAKIYPRFEKDEYFIDVRGGYAPEEWETNHNED